jgi:hypothetical protein
VRTGVRLSDTSVRSKPPSVSVGHVSTSAPRIPAAFSGLVDDAAVFPPGNAPLDEAVRAHHEHLAAPYADLVGPLVVSDAHLAELVSRPAPRTPRSTGEQVAEPLEVVVVVSGGAGALEPAVRWAARDGVLDLRGVEIALRDSATGETAHNARRIVTVVDQLVSSGDLDDDVPVYVEVPRLHGAPPTPDWLSALDELAALDHRVKLRTGGADADAFPGTDELATCIGATLDRELSFKCTAGLHHAVRHRDSETGFERHGFLNVLLATRASLDGAVPADVAAVLDLTDAAALLEVADPVGMAGARRWFRSFGSCSVREPLDDLTALGLLETP